MVRIITRRSDRTSRLVAQQPVRPAMNRAARLVTQG